MEDVFCFEVRNGRIKHFTQCMGFKTKQTVVNYNSFLLFYPFCILCFGFKKRALGDTLMMQIFTLWTVNPPQGHKRFYIVRLYFYQNMQTLRSHKIPSYFSNLLCQLKIWVETLHLPSQIELKF